MHGSVDYGPAKKPLYIV